VELKAPPRLFYALLAGCFAFVAFCYISVAVAGYLLFGSPVNGNPNPVGGDILDNLPRTTAVTVSRVALGFTQLFSYPIVFNSHRANVVGLLPPAWQARLRELEQKEGGGGEAAALSVRLLAAAPARGCAARLLRQWPHALLTAGLVALSVLLALVVPSLSTILGVKGALGGTVIVYALPALMNFELTRRARHQGARAFAAAPGTPPSHARGSARRGSAFDAPPTSPLLWGADSEATPRSEATPQRAAAGEPPPPPPPLLAEFFTTPHGLAVVVLVPWAAVVMCLGMLTTFNLI
jgi:hypothetical protein